MGVIILLTETLAFLLLRFMKQLCMYILHFLNQNLWVH